MADPLFNSHLHIKKKIGIYKQDSVCYWNFAFSWIETYSWNLKGSSNNFMEIAPFSGNYSYSDISLGKLWIKMRGMRTSGSKRKESTASFLSLDCVLPSMRTNLIPFSERKTYMESTWVKCMNIFSRNHIIRQYSLAWFMASN